MSATTTTTPAKQESDEEIMREWDGVRHFKTWRMCEIPPAVGVLVMNCGETEEFDGQINPPETIYENECPLCAAIHEELCNRFS